jgi:alpha-L-fucosidase 2
VENPELYALWPFRLCGVGATNLALAADTFQHRREKASIGWQYDGQCAAIAGLADDAARILLGKVRNSNRNFRFPAMWGPNYDWLPDQDHGANIMLTLQDMLLQADGDKIFLLPAWPKDWDVSFKLRAPGNTLIECDYRAGKLQKLKVTPESRRKDVETRR